MSQCNGSHSWWIRRLGGGALNRSRTKRSCACGGATARHALASVIAALALAAAPQHAAGEPNLRVESDAAGYVGVVARGVSITEALEALGARAGFDVVVADASTRPPVTLNVPQAPVEDVLRELLRGRNYALVYDSEDDVSQVILLAPSTASRARPAPQRRPARQPRKGKQQGPVVIRK